MNAQNKFCFIVAIVLRERAIAAATPRRSPRIEITSAASIAIVRAIGGRERGGVVDAIAHHRGHASLRRQSRDLRHLAVGSG